MSGTVTVTRTRDWLTPFEVEVAPEGRPASTAKFAAASKAQTYALASADAHKATLVYRDVDVMRPPLNNGAPQNIEPRVVSIEEFQARYTRICSRCKESKPLNCFEGIYHKNRRGRAVFHGYQAKCRDCADGQ